MTLTDYIVLFMYASGLIGVGVYFATQVKTTSEMFAAGGRSPWWVSGLSGFMTMFSAGTFVVWGGIAYRYGLVAVLINACYGASALAVGWTIAGRWRSLGVSSAAQFLELRYGRSIVQLYTWLQGVLNIFMMGGTIYALAAVVTELIVLPGSWEAGPLAFLRDDGSGQLSELWTSVIVMAAVIVVTLSGGLWSVLVTDTLQFIVLCVSVVVVVPLILTEVGGVGAFIDGISKVTVDGAGNTLQSPIAHDYTWWFLMGWVIVHYFKIGGEWAFVQRFTCVPSARDARRSALLFGVMYLVSPLFWMLPAIAYRLLEPIPQGLPPDLLAWLGHAELDQLDPDLRITLESGGWATMDSEVIDSLRERAINNKSERAYINACASVLPPGMVGLMVAAMISATASMATTQLNVFAAAFTNEFYKRFIAPLASERALVAVGRIFTVLLGLITLAGAFIIPGTQGGYTGFIIAMTGATAIPLTLPTIWGLLSKRVGLAAAWTATLTGIGAALVTKLVLQSAGVVAWASSDELSKSVLAGFVRLLNSNVRVTDWVVGLAVPSAVLLVFELLGSTKIEHPGWVRAHSLPQAKAGPVQASRLPAIMSGWTTIGIGSVMVVLSVIHADDRVTLLAFGVLLGGIGGGILTLPRIFKQQSGPR